MRLIKLITIIFTFTLLAFSTSGAESSKTYTVADGLLDSHINCIYQDKSGNLWFGSNKGISRFDGMSFKQFPVLNGDDNVPVISIFEDKNGLLWIVTKINVQLWSGAEFKEIFKYHGLTSFCFDSAGNKWLGSKEKIVILGEGADEKENSAISSIKGVTALYRDRDSNIWIGTDNGAYVYDGKNVVEYTTEDGIIGNNINSIYDDGENIFLATDAGISYYNGRLWAGYAASDGLADNYATSVFKDFRGKYWFGTKSGLSIYDSAAANYYDAWKKVTTKQGLADNYITCLYLDRSANLWVGTKNGATKYNISFDSLTQVHGNKEKLSAPVFYDMQKRLWFSTEDGATLFINNNYERLKEENGISGKVLSFYQSADDGKIFFGTESGVNEYVGDEIVKTYTPVPKKREWHYKENGAYMNDEVFPDKDVGLVGHKVIAMTKDAEGDLWFATEMALNKLSGASAWTTYTRDEGLLDNKVNALLNDEGTLYIATSAGINTYSNEEFGDPITTKEGLPHNNVLCMFKDKKGNLWFGTQKGVCKYNKGKVVKNLTAKDGIPSEKIKAIFQDARGFFWFSAEEGLIKYDGENFSMYTTADGLLTNEATSIAQNKSGILIFGTQKGIIRYQPDNTPPAVVVKNAPTEPIALPKYTFEVGGADLNSKRDELLYSCKLDDGEWTKFSLQTVYPVDKLANGTHTLSVRAKDKALNVTNPPLALNFEVNTKMFDLEIVDLKFKELFSALYQYYNSLKDVETAPLDEITLKNNFDEDIKVKISVFIKDYMDYPADTKVTVKAKSVNKIPFKLELNENILNTVSGYKKVNVSLQYYLHGENKESSINSNVMIYDKNTISWDDPRKLGAFVTADEKVVTNFTRSVIQMYKDESRDSIIYGNLIRAIALFDAIGAYGVRYVADPTSPYTGLVQKENALDTLRFPKETLALKSGDCDDCITLYCAMLENIGINTAAIDTYDHLFMMFDVGLKRKDLKQITSEEGLVFIDENDKVWIPVETTLFGENFSKAWENGAKKFSSVKDKSIYYLQNAWKDYKPAEVNTTDEEAKKIAAPSKEIVDKIYKEDIIIQEGNLLYNLVNKYEEMIKADPANVQAYNKLGVVYGKSGYFDKAEENFRKVIELKPDFAGGYLNLGNILFEKEYYKEAVQEYKKGLALDPNNAYMYIELAIAYSMLDDFVSAKEAYLSAIKINPDIEEDVLKGK